MKSLEVLNQYDWDPYKKRKFEYRHLQKEDHMEIQGKDCQPQAKDKNLKRTQPY